MEGRGITGSHYPGIRVKVLYLCDFCQSKKVSKGKRRGEREARLFDQRGCPGGVEAFGGENCRDAGGSEEGSFCDVILRSRRHFRDISGVVQELWPFNDLVFF